MKKDHAMVVLCANVPATERIVLIFWEQGLHYFILEEPLTLVLSNIVGGADAARDRSATAVSSLPRAPAM